MTQLYIHSFNRRSTLVDHDGVRSCQTERVNQLIRKRWCGYEIIEEEIVPDDQFIPVMHGTSDWTSRFDSLNTKPFNGNPSRLRSSSRQIKCGQWPRKVNEIGYLGTRTIVVQHLYMDGMPGFEPTLLDSEIVPLDHLIARETGDYSNSPWRSRFLPWIPVENGGTMLTFEE
jgi:hypothetical protein